jgi:dolichyl-phosphate-mannose-protein mannosyltransferase
MFSSNSKIWLLGLVAALGVLSWGLFRDFTQPWTVNLDFNGACWSQSAHNTLRAGLRATAGVPSAFYFGPLPIPPSGYYTHHPPLLSMTLAGMFVVLGEHEWVARLLPIAFSLSSLVLLWLMVKECAGNRAAAFSALLFAAMPMELFYGRMVNFEPIDLVWMLGGLLCLRRWEQTGQPRWRNSMLAAFVLALWTAWLGYMFVLVVCIHFFVTPGRRNPRLALLLLGLCLASVVLFLLHIRWVQPNAWQNLIDAFNRRMSTQLVASGPKITWAAWCRRIGGSLTEHIQPIAWVLALIGAVRLVRRRSEDERLRWLGWAALCFFVLSAFYIVAFRNASYIHDYASFYFIVPVAIAGGVALDAFAGWCEWRGGGTKPAGLAATLVVFAWLVFSGERQALALNKPFRILDWDKPEPAELIPELGRAIHKRFPEGTTVICNFLTYYGPQIHYYAQRTILNCIFGPDDWINATKGPENAPVGGVIWLGEPNAKEVLAALPTGSREEISVRGVPFCFWRPER